MLLHQSSYYELSYNSTQSVVTLLWSEQTQNMEDHNFQEALLRLADASLEHKSKNVLVNVERFQHPVGESLMFWREKTILPIYQKSEFNKFAYVVGADTPLPPSSDSADYNFATCFFNTEDQAQEWFLQ